MALSGSSPCWREKRLRSAELSTSQPRPYSRQWRREDNKPTSGLEPLLEPGWHLHIFIGVKPRYVGELCPQTYSRNEASEVAA